MVAVVEALSVVMEAPSHRWTGRQLFSIICGLWGRGLLVDGAGPFAAIDNAEEGVRWSSLDGDGTDDGSARRPWRVERQRPRIATIVVMGFVLAGPEPVEGNESVRDS